MIEYILIAGVNDSLECANLLGELLAPRNVMLNVIPYNDTTQVIVNKSFKAPSWGAVEAFQREVVKHGVITRVRREMGDDIAAACGQLALTNEADAGAGPSTPAPALLADAGAPPPADMEDWGRPRGYPSQPQAHLGTDAASRKPTGVNVKKVTHTTFYLAHETQTPTKNPQN